MTNSEWRVDVVLSLLAIHPQSSGATGGIDSPPLGFGAASGAGLAGASAATGTEPVASTT